MSLVYAGALLVSITGMAVLDHRFRLFFAAAPRRAAVVLAIGVAFFLVWDVAGIALGVFFRGSTPFMTGWLIAPELPVEEVLFLVLLCYLTMNVHAAFARRGARATAVAGDRPCRTCCSTWPSSRLPARSPGSRSAAA